MYGAISDASWRGDERRVWRGEKTRSKRGGAAHGASRRMYAYILFYSNSFFKSIDTVHAQDGGGPEETKFRVIANGYFGFIVSSRGGEGVRPVVCRHSLALAQAES